MGGWGWGGGGLGSKCGGVFLSIFKDSRRFLLLFLVCETTAGPFFRFGLYSEFIQFCMYWCSV